MKCLFRKFLLWQNFYSQNLYLAKMSTVPKPKCPVPKCLLSRLNPDGPFRKEISFIHKEFSRHFGILQPILTVYNEFVFWKMYDSLYILPTICFLTIQTKCMKVCIHCIHSPNKVKKVTSLVKGILGVDIFAQ